MKRVGVLKFSFLWNKYRILQELSFGINFYESSGARF